MIAVSTPGGLLDVIGEDATADRWFTVDQARIDAFADTTDDHQWIHVDPERAAQGPFGATVAHDRRHQAPLACGRPAPGRDGLITVVRGR